jgi:flagellar hook-associated protein 2
MSSNFISGLVSGLDTTALIDALVTARSKPVVLLQERQAQSTAQLSAWKSLEAILLSLKVETDRLANSSLWTEPLVTSSDEEVLTAAATSGAALGSFTFFVTALAASEQEQSQAYSSKDELVGEGTLTLTQGSVVTEVETDSATTLADLADLVNEAGAGVSASIARSNTGGVESFHLVFTAEETGAASAFSVSGTLSGGTSPTFSLTRAGQDAEVELGGEGGLAIHSSTNTFEDLLEGLDITISKAQEAGEGAVVVEVRRDKSGLEAAVLEFIDRYNTSIEFVNGQFDFDPEVGVRPPLMGEATLINIMAEVRSLVTGPVEGLGSADFTSLFSVGLKSSADGTLTFDASAFGEALDSNYDAVADLFRLNATFDASGIALLSADPDLELAGKTVEIVVSEAASRASLAGDTIDPTGGITIDSSNDAFRVEIDGVLSEELILAHGTYTKGAVLAQAIETAIGSSDDLGALSLSVTFDEKGMGLGNLVVSSIRYGSSGSFRLQNSDSSFGDKLGLADVLNTTAEGRDVEGTIDGVAAEGNGRILKAAAGSELETLSFEVTLLDAGVPATIQAGFSEGVARVASRRLASLTEPGDGTLSRLEKTVEQRIDAVAADIELKLEALERRRERLREQFVALESTLNRLQSQGAFLEAQFQSFLAQNGSLRTGR